MRILTYIIGTDFLGLQKITSVREEHLLDSGIEYN